MNADSFPQMASAQWAEIRRRARYRVIDAKALLDYWDRIWAQYFEQWAGRWGGTQAGTGLNDEFNRYQARAKAARELLGSPTDTFNFRHVIEEAQKRFALAVEQLRQEKGDTVPDMRLPTASPIPPIPGDPSVGPIPGSPIPPERLPVPGGPGATGNTGLIKLVLLYLIVRNL